MQPQSNPVGSRPWHRKRLPGRAVCGTLGRTPQRNPRSCQSIAATNVGWLPRHQQRQPATKSTARAV